MEASRLYPELTFYCTPVIPQHVYYKLNLRSSQGWRSAGTHTGQHPSRELPANRVRTTRSPILLFFRLRKMLKVHTLNSREFGKAGSQAQYPPRCTKHPRTLVLAFCFLLAGFVVASCSCGKAAEDKGPHQLDAAHVISRALSQHEAILQFQHLCP